MNSELLKFFKVVGQVESCKRICPNHRLVNQRGTKRFNTLRGDVMEFFLGLPKITKSDITIWAVVGCCIQKLTHVTSNKFLTLYGIGETM